MDNIYKPPQSDLAPELPETGPYGSIEKGINGDYELSIGDTIKEAWDLTRRAKGKINSAIFLSYITVIPILFITGPLLAITGLSKNLIASIFANFLIQIVLMGISYPLWAGVFMIGIRRSVQIGFPIKIIYGYFGYAVPLLITGVIMTILIFLGTILLLLPGLYLIFAYMLALPLVVEKGLSPWQALETSRKTITHKWFKFVGLLIVLWLLLCISALPLGIGLIWTMPLALVSMGIAYRNMFGVENLQNK